MAWHGPGVHVVFVTMSGTLRGGPIGDEYKASIGRSNAPQSKRWERRPPESVVGYADID
jgi:hypothetical protein